MPVPKEVLDNLARYLVDQGLTQYVAIGLWEETPDSTTAARDRSKFSMTAMCTSCGLVRHYGGNMGKHLSGCRCTAMHLDNLANAAAAASQGATTPVAAAVMDTPISMPQNGMAGVPRGAPSIPDTIPEDSSLADSQAPEPQQRPAAPAATPNPGGMNNRAPLGPVGNDGAPPDFSWDMLDGVGLGLDGVDMLPDLDGFDWDSFLLAGFDFDGSGLGGDLHDFFDGASSGAPGRG